MNPKIRTTYLSNPKKCGFCEKAIPFAKRKNSHCDKVCSNKAMRRDGLNPAFKNAGSTKSLWEKKFGRDEAEKREMARNEKHSRTLTQMIASGEIVPKSHGGKQGVFRARSGEEFRYASSYELRRMKFLDSIDATWTKNHKVVIPYTVNGKQRNYVPDLLVIKDMVVYLEEIKGWIRDQEVHSEKCVAAQEYCRRMGWLYRVIGKDKLETI